MLESSGSSRNLLIFFLFSSMVKESTLSSEIDLSSELEGAACSSWVSSSASSPQERLISGGLISGGFSGAELVVSAIPVE